MSDSLLAAAILGLARRPLSADDRAAATALLGTEVADAEAAVSLAAEADLKRRGALPTIAVDTDAREVAPPHPYPADLAEAASTYVLATASLLRAPDVHWFWQRGVPVPPEQLLIVLEHHIRTTAPRPRAYALLGTRGAWLGARHPAYATKCAWLQRDAPPATAKRRAAYAAYHLAQLARPAYWRDASATTLAEGALTRALETHGLRGDDAALLLSAFRQNLPCIRSAVAALLVDERKTSPLSLLLQRLHGERVTAPDAALASVSTDIEAFAEHAAYALTADDEALAAQLLEQAFVGRQLLHRRHPLLPALFAVLSPEAFAKSSAHAIRHVERPFGDPHVAACFRESGRALSLADSVDLVDRMHDARSFQVNLLAAEWVAQLHLGCVDHLLELLHDTGGTPQHERLLAALTARRRMEAALAGLPAAPPT